MRRKSCGCTTPTCGCCEGTSKHTSAGAANRPGLDELRYRVGVHGEFLETMKARLASMAVDGVGADGQTVETFRPLEGLTTRESSDFSIALLDGWATVGDVLTFYQERIANEGYLRTATERRSVLELARLTGYSLKPGVASTVYLAYTLDDKQIEPVEIPIGARSQSIPGPDEFPQSFETAEKLEARTEWNNLQVRMSRPQQVTFSTVLTLKSLFVKGTSTELRAGDKLLFEFTGNNYAVRVVEDIVADFTGDRTEIRPRPLNPGTPECVDALAEFIPDARAIADNTGSGTDGLYLETARDIYRETLLGIQTSPLLWVDRMAARADNAMGPEMAARGAELNAEIQSILDTVGGPGSVLTTSPATFVNSLLIPAVPQARGSARLRRSLRTAARVGTDLTPRLLVNFQPRLKESYYTAWRNATVNSTPPTLVGVSALRARATLFGSSVQRMATFDANGNLNTPDKWAEWTLDNTESSDTMHLGQIYDGMSPGSPVLVQTNKNGRRTRGVFNVTAAEDGPRTAYALSGKSTRLTLDEEWWQGSKDSMSNLRSTIVYGEADGLEVVEEPITEDIAGNELELADLYQDLDSGRWVIVSGERSDIAGVAGVRASELMMVSGLRHDYDPNLPGDKTHTTLLLATETAYSYQRDSVVVYGNVVKATHGETRLETLGSGDGTQSLQEFVLKQAPLTFVPASTPSGVASTLQVFVNDVEWSELDTLACARGTDRVFVSKTDNDDKTSVIFGNGETGSRLPSGVENVSARFRNGIGKPGNVRPEQISLLQTMPLGVRSVVNPLRASGGADRESLNQARGNAPLAVMSLDRLVSIQDYEDFTRSFAGIGKASVRRLSDGRREFIHLTIAGADDILIDGTSDLYRNLLDALQRFGSTDMPVRVDVRELLALTLSANIKLAANYQWEPVVERIRDSILGEFGFSRRRLAQSALRSEIVSVIQAVQGVAYVDVDAFAGIPEKRLAEDGDGNLIRRLLTPDEMSAALLASLHGTASARVELNRPSQDVRAAPANVIKGLVIPAQLAIFSPDVPDTLILNQIV